MSANWGVSEGNDENEGAHAHKRLEEWVSSPRFLLCAIALRLESIALIGKEREPRAFLAQSAVLARLNWERVVEKGAPAPWRGAPDALEMIEKSICSGAAMGAREQALSRALTERTKAFIPHEKSMHPQRLRQISEGFRWMGFCVSPGAEFMEDPSWAQTQAEPLPRFETEDAARLKMEEALEAILARGLELLIASGSIELALGPAVFSEAVSGASLEESTSGELFRDMDGSFGHPRHGLEKRDVWEKEASRLFEELDIAKNLAPSAAPAKKAVSL